MNFSEEKIKELDKLFAPDPSVIIWKYMDLPKFLSLLQFKVLHFTKANKFKDVFEGKIPEIFLNAFPADIKQSHLKMHNTFDQYKNETFINCWSALDGESYALWQIYGNNYGVAIQTTVGKLLNALNCSQAKLCKVKYINRENKNGEMDIPYLKEENGGLRRNFFVFKPLAYEYESEVRIIVIGRPDEDHKEISVDLDNLVESVYVSPFEQQWFGALVEKIVREKYKISSFKIYRSNIEIQ